MIGRNLFEPGTFFPRMRTIALIFFFVASTSRADDASTFLDYLCVHGFTKTMPKVEANRFCACVTEDVSKGLSDSQRRVLIAVKADLDKGRAPSAERMASSGVRELVMAGQARCEAAFYPPSNPIFIAAGPLQLTLRCDSDTRAPEAFVYGRNMELLSKAEQRAADQRMMKGIFEPDYAKVVQAIDGVAYKSENWEIDLTGEIVSPPNEAELIDRLRTASTLSLSIERGGKKFKGTFQLSGHIPPRWAPCGGVFR